MSKIVECGAQRIQTSSWRSKFTFNVLLFGANSLCGGTIGLFFFENEQEHGERYSATITDVLLPEIEVHDLSELRFQHSGATCHTFNETVFCSLLQKIA